MGKDGRTGRHPRTTPSQAIGESGDQEARKEADRAVKSDGPERSRPGPAGRDAQRGRPGVGREEQIRSRPRADSPEPDSPEPESDDR